MEERNLAIGFVVATTLFIGGLKYSANEVLNDRSEQPHLGRIYDINRELRDANKEDLIRDGDLRQHLENLLEERSQIESLSEYKIEYNKQSKEARKNILLGTGVAFSGLLSMCYIVYNLLKGKN